MLSGLSDEQVRRLLIEELKADAAAPAYDPEAEVSLGPGAFLGDILNELEETSVSSDHQAKKLFAHLPDVLPDLYKVFITL